MSRKKSALLIILALIAIALAGYLIITILTSPPKILQEKKGVVPGAACESACSLVTEPDDGIVPVMKMIAGATKEIDLVIYELTDPAIETALVNAARHRVIVRVLLSPDYEGAPSAVNFPAYDNLRAKGVDVRWSPDYFALTHEKSFIFDRTTGFIMSFNLVPKYYPPGRDFGVIDRDAKDVAAMESRFDADWRGSEDSPAATGNDLVWSPGSRTALVQLIASSVTSLLVYNEEMADVGIEDALAAAARRGVAVKIIMTYSPDWIEAFKKLSSAGVVIKTFPPKSPLYIHAKMIVSDDMEAFLGSENFSANSLDDNRELGLMIQSGEIIQSLTRIFNGDWGNAEAFQK